MDHTPPSEPQPFDGHPAATPPAAAVLPGAGEAGVNPRVPARHRGRTLLAWSAVVLMVVVVFVMQSVGRGGTPAEVAPDKPADVGAMEITMIGRHSIGSAELGGGAFGGPLVDQLVDQLTQTADEHPLQQMRASGYVLFLRNGHGDDALALLNKAAAWFDALPEAQRAEWAEKGYLQDLAAFRAIASDGPDALPSAERDRLTERYGDAADAALAARLDKADPLRQRVAAKGKRTTAALLGALVVIGVAGVAGLTLMIVGAIQISRGRIRAGYRTSLRPPDGEPQPQPPPAVTLETFAWFLAGFLVLQVVMELVLVRLARSQGWSDGATTLITYGVLWAVLLVALWPRLCGMSGAWTRRALGWHTGRGVLREVGAGIVGYLAGLPIVAVGFAGVFMMSILMELIGGDSTASHPATDVMASGDTLTIIAMYMLGVCWAPIVEETFFRGALQHHLRRRHGFLLSGLVTAFVFAIIHPQGVVGVPVLVAIGFVFSMIREWRGSLIGGMVAHTLNNGFVFTMLTLALG
jgi:membrane protease YdiL (CAAX protease family)